MRSYRKLFALFCIAIVAFAVLAPAAASHDFLVFLIPIWAEFQPHFVVVCSLDPTSSQEQPVSLRSLGASRAPPAALSA